MRRTARALLDLGALRHNVRRAAEAAPGSRVMAVVKADAYGHGMRAVAETLDGLCDAFAVSYVDEGISLRDMGIRCPVATLQGFRDEAELAAAAAAGLAVTVHQEHHLRLLETARLSRPVAVWIKIDTGMNRLGFSPSRVAAIHAGLTGCPNVAGTPGLISHLARADEPGLTATERQKATFDMATSGLAGERTLANSAAILSHPETRYDWVRPGIMLYGATPFAGESAGSRGLLPVMTVVAPLIAINRLSPGETIGYGGTYVCEREMKVGVAAIGYGDGYPRHVPNGTPVVVRGRRVPTVGRVSMDLITIDLTDLPDATVGDEAVFWGGELPVDEIAALAGTIGYELLCAVGGRLQVRQT